MAKIFGNKIPYLVAKATAGGQRFYWQPSRALEAAGWKAMSLGTDMLAAIAAAKARNDTIEEWRTGGAKPRAVKTFVRRATVAALIRAYKASDRYTRLAPNTRVTYASALGLIERWATDKQPGDIPAALITSQRVKVLRNALMQPGENGIVQHHRAHNTLRVGRTLFAFGRSEMEGIVDNPFEAFDLPSPEPRDQIWDALDIAAFCRAAEALKLPGLGFAVELAAYTGQREADLIAATRANLGEVHRLSQDSRAKLGDERGRVTGLYFKQQKTRVPIVVPLDLHMLGRIEATIAANQKREVASSHILVNDLSGRPWAARHFIRKFNEVRQWAIDPPEKARAAGVEPRPALADLQFRDLRRTCIVGFGELGLSDGEISSISGHRLASIKRILETYCPRTPQQGANAVVARLDLARRDKEDREKKA